MVGFGHEQCRHAEPTRSVSLLGLDQHGNPKEPCISEMLDDFGGRNSFVTSSWNPATEAKKRFEDHVDHQEAGVFLVTRDHLRARMHTTSPQDTRHQACVIRFILEFSKYRVVKISRLIPQHITRCYTKSSIALHPSQSIRMSLGVLPASPQSPKLQVLRGPRLPRK